MARTGPVGVAGEDRVGGRPRCRTWCSGGGSNSPRSVPGGSEGGVSLPRGVPGGSDGASKFARGVPGRSDGGADFPRGVPEGSESGFAGRDRGPGRSGGDFLGRGGAPGGSGDGLPRCGHLRTAGGEASGENEPSGSSCLHGMRRPRVGARMPEGSTPAACGDVRPVPGSPEPAGTLGRSTLRPAQGFPGCGPSSRRCGVRLNGLIIVERSRSAAA